MSNLLLKQTKQKVLWQRRNRLLIMLAVAVLLGSVIVYISVLPIMVYTYVLNSNIVNKSSVIQDNNTGKQRKQLREELKKRKKIIDSVRSVYAQAGILSTASALVKDLTMVTDINLTQLDIRYTEMMHNLYITGSTKSRASMVNLRNLLNRYEDLSIIDFPISNFAPDQDGLYKFTIKLKYNKDYE